MIESIAKTVISGAGLGAYANDNGDIEPAGAGNVGSAKQALLSKENNLTLGDANTSAGIVDIEAANSRRQAEVQAGQKNAKEKSLSMDEFVSAWTGEKIKISG